MGKRVTLVAALWLCGLVACDDGETNGVAPDGSGLLDLPVVHNDGGGHDKGPDAEVAADTPGVDTVGQDTLDAAETAADVAPEAAAEVVQEVSDEVDGSPGAKVYGGGVLLSEVDSEFVNTAVAAARFTALVPEPSPDQVFGPCTVSFQDPDNPAPEGFGFDGGSITIAATTPTVILNPVGEGANGTGYSSNISSTQEDLLPQGGAIMSVALAGGADIGVATVTVQAPEAMTLLAPDVSGFTGGSASKSTPLNVSWGVGNGDQIVVTISPLSSDLQPEPESGDALSCVLTGDSGSVTIPADALAAVGNGKYALGVTRVKLGTGKDDVGNTVSATVTRSTGGILNIN